MTSPVSVCQLALSHIGDGTSINSISPPDGSRQAELCAQFFPIARDVALEHGWSFNTRRADLALLDVSVPPGWLYAFALPASCFKPLEIRSVNTSSSVDTEDFITESLSDGSRVIYANVEDASLKYTVRTPDLARWTPSAIYALSWLLASMLSGSLIKGKTGAQVGRDAFSRFLAIVAESQASDANTRQQDDLYKDRRPHWLSDR